ncbi:MAG: YdcF family protein [Bacteroidetes bacterium]|nr:YdcF family protein [Bacteroidota bacterium]MBS1684899.1 YdcF family protein [Bacteroidota bacterium]
MKRILAAIAILVVLIVAVLTWCDHAVKTAAKGRLYTDTASLPYRRSGLLLGTAKYINGTHLNPYYYYRIEAAAALLKSGKISYLIISGDNSRKDYDEPSDMRADLIARGADSTHIYLDYAGFRTFDSMRRAREVFGQDSVTVISQLFHDERALYIAQREGIDAIGYCARDISVRAGIRTQLRERFARVKVFVDYIIGQEPKFLGKKIVVG